MWFRQTRCSCITLQPKPKVPRARIPPLTSHLSVIPPHESDLTTAAIDSVDCLCPGPISTFSSFSLKGSKFGSRVILDSIDSLDALRALDTVGSPNFGTSESLEVLEALKRASCWNLGTCHLGSYRQLGRLARSRDCWFSEPRNILEASEALKRT